MTFQCGKLNLGGTPLKTDVLYMFYTKFHPPRSIFYSPSSKCTSIGERESISFPQCLLRHQGPFKPCIHNLYIRIMILSQKKCDCLIIWNQSPLWRQVHSKIIFLSFYTGNTITNHYLLRSLHAHFQNRMTCFYNDTSTTLLGSLQPLFSIHF